MDGGGSLDARRFAFRQVFLVIDAEEHVVAGAGCGDEASRFVPQPRHAVFDRPQKSHRGEFGGPVWRVGREGIRPPEAVPEQPRGDFPINKAQADGESRSPPKPS